MFILFNPLNNRIILVELNHLHMDSPTRVTDETNSFKKQKN